MSDPQTYSLYGDESGSLRNLRDGDGEVFVQGVVAGPQEDCIACPRRAVRKARDMPEAKWSDLTDVQKRRFIECFSDGEHDLTFAFATLTPRSFENLEYEYVLYQEDPYGHDWDMFVAGVLYAAIIKELTNHFGSKPSPFIFDRICAKSQSNQVSDVVRRAHGSIGVSHESSRQAVGIQAADCFAGAVAEAHRYGNDYLVELADENVIDVSEYAHIAVEKSLHEVDTVP